MKQNTKLQVLKVDLASRYLYTVSRDRKQVIDITQIPF